MAMNKNVVNCILIALIIVVSVHYIFKCPNIDNFYPTIKSQSAAYKPSAKSEAVQNNDDISENPLPYNEDASMKYLTNTLLGQTEDVSSSKKAIGCPEFPLAGCPKPAKSQKQFHKDFFAFRDMTQNNSSIRYDPVDKIQELYLDGNLSDARRYPNMKIKDIFDNATAGPSLYTRQCVRLPQFDNVNSAGYQMSYGQHPMNLSGVHWEYPNEKVINGAAIKPGLYGADPYASTSLPVKMLDQNLEINYGHKK